MFKAKGGGAKVGVGGITHYHGRWNGNVILPWKELFFRCLEAFIDNVTTDLFEGTKPKGISK